MPHSLDFIKREHILMAINELSVNPIPDNNRINHYWVNYEGVLYKYKDVVQLASVYANNPLEKDEFKSDHSTRKYISDLDFHILFKNKSYGNNYIRYWVGASYYGSMDDQTDMIDSFFEDNYWATDHDLTKGEGLYISKQLSDVRVHDRICIRYFDKKNNKIDIAAIGTITGNDNIGNGKLSVIWDYNPKRFNGNKPSGTGSGNWWKSFFKLKRNEDIVQLFGGAFIEKRISRIAWNDNGWIKPSGKVGKSEHEKSHEAEYGYGHEEWLFDTSKLIDGYHYGFLEPVRKEQDAYEGKVFSCWLYTVNYETKDRFWIGEINNLQVINKETAEYVKETYIEKGWLNEMESQIVSSGANKIGFSNWEGIDLFNVRFKPEELNLNDKYILLPSGHPVYEQSRYSFMHYKREFELSELSNDDGFIFRPKENDKDIDENVKTSTYSREPRLIEITQLHNAISKSLTKHLRDTTKHIVTREHLSGHGANKIDIIAKDGDKLIFYEIKTYSSIRVSVREALGQLIEYGYYPNRKNATEFIVVSHLPADDHTKLYFKHLREQLNFAIYYQHYDLDKRELSIRI